MNDLFPDTLPTDPLPDGVSHLQGYFSPSEQAALVTAVAAATRTAPFFQPRMPGTGTPTSVIMTNFGTLGWVASKTLGYRYQPTHPDTDTPWPPMPELLTRLWQDTADWPDLPECCLVNWYRPARAAKMGAHVDNDEHAASAPIVSVSLGDSATYRVGNLVRGGKTRPIPLHSGDVVILSGPSRQRYHAISKVEWGTSDLLSETDFPGGGRLNLTLRRVMP